MRLCRRFLVAGLVGIVRWWDYRRGGDGDVQLPALIGGVAAVIGGVWTALVLDWRAVRRPVVAGAAMALAGCALLLCVTLLWTDASVIAVLLLGAMFVIPALSTEITPPGARTLRASRAWYLLAAVAAVPLVPFGAAVAQRVADRL